MIEKYNTRLMKMEILVVTLLLLSYPESTMPSLVQNGFREQCHNDGSVLKCESNIPHNIDDNVKDVELIDIDQTELSDGVFCAPAWTNITKLSITCDKRCSEITGIENNVFRCLENLQTLKINLGSWSFVENNTFAGLQRVSALDISGCFCINTKGLITMLADMNNIPRLSGLVLTGIAMHCGHKYLELTQPLVDIFSTSKITAINLSATRLVFDKSLNLETLCTSVTTINVSDTSFINWHSVQDHFLCASLRTLDLSGIFIYSASATLPKVVDVPGISFVFSENRFPNVLSSISGIYLNRILPDHTFYFHKTSLTLLANNSFKDVHLTGYNIPTFGRGI